VRTKVLLAALLVMLGAGCTLTHYTPLRKDFYMTAGMPDSQYERVGVVHAEAWTPGLVYLVPLSPGTSLVSAQEALINEARAQGANGIVGLRCYVETHMPYLWLAGWMEYHLSGIAVKFKDPK
jgi:hypothetical protein